MAKVKIQGSASGTGILSVVAPNTSTDRTITLPDATMTIPEYTTGSWTPTLSSNFTATISDNKYVRIGNLVNLWVKLGNIQINGASGALTLSNIPFTQGTAEMVGGNSMLNYVNISGGSTYNIAIYLTGNALYIYRSEDNSEWTAIGENVLSDNDDLYINMTYYTEA